MLISQIWLWLGLLMGFIAKWIDSLDIGRIQKIFYLFSTLLIVLALIRFLKKSKKSPTLKAGAERTVVLADNPEATAKNLLYTAEKLNKGGNYFMEKIKKLFKFLWANKITLGSLLITLAEVAYISFMLITEKLAGWEWFADKQWLAYVFIGVGIVIVVILVGYGIINNKGMETVEAWQKRLAELKEALSSGLTKEQKKEIKEQIGVLENALESKKNEYKKADKEYESLSAIVKVGIADEKQIARYNELINNKNDLAEVILQYENKLKELEAQI